MGRKPAVERARSETRDGDDLGLGLTGAALKPRKRTESEKPRPKPDPRDDLPVSNAYLTFAYMRAGKRGVLRESERGSAIPPGVGRDRLQAFTKDLLHAMPVPCRASLPGEEAGSDRPRPTASAEESWAWRRRCCRGNAVH